MNSFNYRQSHTNIIMNMVPNVLAWLSDKKLNAHVSRYSRYENYINDYYKEMSSMEVMEEKFKKLTMAFQELFEIVQVYNSFKDENSYDFNERLKKVIRGKDLITESIDKNNDPSRDFLYELLIAADFKSKGFSIDFNDEADVIASKNLNTIFIECKRLKSKTSLEQNFKKAGKQLSLRNKKNSYGLIFVDITNCISDKIKYYEYNNEFEMRNDVSLAVSQYGKTNSNIITTLNDKFINDSLGVCMTFNKCLWMSNLQINYYRDVNVLASNNLSNDLYSKLNELLKG